MVFGLMMTLSFITLTSDRQLPVGNGNLFGTGWGA